VSRFDTTQWSQVLRARDGSGGAREALESLCRTYRPPVLAYVRSRGYSRETAEDLTQAFFTRFLEHASHASADPERGRFRAFLLTAVKRFLINADEEAHANKRGGRIRFESFDAASECDADPGIDQDTPERAFDRAWAQVVLDAALQRLHEEAARADKEALFGQLRDFLIESPDDSDYARVSETLKVRRNTLAVAVHRLRRRLRELVRDELEKTAADRAAVEGELRQLRGALGNVMR
jgi:RNA polymerase sigma-70 factor (ECF subfamily)